MKRFFSGRRSLKAEINQHYHYDGTRRWRTTILAAPKSRLISAMAKKNEEFGGCTVWFFCHINTMKSQITYWKETDGKFLGYLNDHPDHWTQGDDLEDLKAHLRDLYQEFTTHDLPGIKKMEEIEVG